MKKKKKVPNPYVCQAVCWYIQLGSTNIKNLATPLQPPILYLCHAHGTCPLTVTHNLVNFQLLLYAYEYQTHSNMNIYIKLSQTKKTILTKSCRKLVKKFYKLAHLCSFFVNFYT